jgi:hypothetical protein
MAFEDPEEPDEPFGVEELIEDAKEGGEGLKEKVKHLAESAKAKVISGEKPPHDEELVEFVVTIHNKGEEDYLFNPMQLQLYDLNRRSVQIRAKHEDGTTLGKILLKPGETYTGKLFVKKDQNRNEGIMFFKDLSLEYEVLFLVDKGDPVKADPELRLEEDYLYGDEEVLAEQMDYKRQ